MTNFPTFRGKPGAFGETGAGNGGALDVSVRIRTLDETIESPMEYGATEFDFPIGQAGDFFFQLTDGNQNAGPCTLEIEEAPEDFAWNAEFISVAVEASPGGEEGAHLYNVVNDYQFLKVRLTAGETYDLIVTPETTGQNLAVIVNDSIRNEFGARGELDYVHSQPPGAYVRRLPPVGASGVFRLLVSDWASVGAGCALEVVRVQA